ncbi:hypothetical protein Pint_34460 [Pistacia integerrima]|uniref:Uncharacterized protein n=1 Tax=Pistacia integerrima TaxID=434235 RepID=A0ACC0X4H8_9ROSI|nr:hypothetical protein Pint_34460 [Pistacia integerrima]
MGACASKPPKPNPYAPRGVADDHAAPPTPLKDDVSSEKKSNSVSSFFPFYTPSPAFFLKKSPAGATPKGNSTPLRFMRRPFPPPSPAKHIRAVLRRRQSKKTAAAAAIPEEEEEVVELDKRFGFSKELRSKLEMGDEVGRGHFGYTCSAKYKKGEFKDQQVAVKVIPKSKMTTAIAIEDVRREVKILQALTGHNNLVKFYEAFEDTDNVYVVMELCEGGELLDRILARGGKYSEEDAKVVLVQILNVVAFCHLQGVVHRDLKPEPFLYQNFLYTTKDESSQLKAIDFGLSDFVRPDERLNDIVGSAYYVAPEVLHRSYGTEADVWSIGVIAYILLCGSRPFWARTESGIFRAVLKADPSFDDGPWPSLSLEAKDFVKRLLNKDPRRRMTAAQALSECLNFSNLIKLTIITIPKVPMVFFLQVIRGSEVTIIQRTSINLHDGYPLQMIEIQALSKTLTVDKLFYLKQQFALLEPNKNGYISLENIKMALMRNATDTMNDSRIPDFLASLNALQYRKMEFEEFCAAALNVHQLEAHDNWEQQARCAYELFEKDGNRAIIINELASELGLGPSIPLHTVLNDWIRHTDGKLSFLGFVKLLHGVSGRTIVKAQ